MRCRRSWSGGSAGRIRAQCRWGDDSAPPDRRRAQPRLTAELNEDSPGVPGSHEYGDDAFGSSLALGDIDRDGWADLVVGAPGYNLERGRVTVVHGARSGWRTTGNYLFTQNSKGIPGKAERGDWFGGSVTLLDHNRDGRLDLTIGAPGETRIPA